jgi:fumarate hydratase class II
MNGRTLNLKTFDLCLHQRPSLCKLIVHNEILAGRRHAMFPLHLLEEGQRHPVNMNVNEAMPNRCMAKQALGKTWLRDGKGHWQGALRG